MMKSLLRWKNYAHFVLTRSCLAPVIEYGVQNAEMKDRVCLFVDSGESHTSFIVAEFVGVFPVDVVDA